MGSSFSKDKFVDLYMHTDKQYYVAGEYVRGEVYINAKQTRPYSKLSIKIIGEEHVHWQEGTSSNNTRRSYWNDCKNYQDGFTLYTFPNQVDTGQYMFPFSFLLPAMMTGSFYQLSWCYLKYTLRVQFWNTINVKDSQIYDMFLNLIQPPRMPLRPILITNTVNSKCCHCCCDYGLVSITMKADKNFVVNGDKIRVSGTIDNTRGRQKIKKAFLKLQQRIFKTDGYHTDEDKMNQYLLDALNQQIHKGVSVNFDFNCTIPNEITSFTAIGRIVSRYFLLHMYTDYGCCANKAQAVLHIVVHSRTPKIVEKKQIPPPPGWNPQVRQEFIYTSLKPYAYTPLPQIPFLNQPTNQEVVMPTNQEVVMPVNEGKFPLPSQQQLYSKTNEDFPLPQLNKEYSNYQPVYYNQNLFTNQQKQQQGYQPYFDNGSK